MKNKNIAKDARRRSTFAILFYINRTKVRKDGTCQLLCKISIDAEPAQVGIKASVNPDLWNPETGRANGRSENAITVNRAIDTLTKEIKTHYKKIKQSLGFVTAELVKNALTGAGQKPLTLLGVFKEHNMEIKSLVGRDYAEETYKIYERSYRHLAGFIREKYKTADLLLKRLDKDFYNDFERHLYKECSMHEKTVYEELYRLKKMTKRALGQGTIRVDPYARMRPKYPPRKSRHQKLEDLKKLMATPLDKPSLQRVRDWFIFSTNTFVALTNV